MKSLIHTLWSKDPEAEGISRSVLPTLADARAAVPYALSRIDDIATLPHLLKILELERARKNPDDAAQAAAEEHARISTVFVATEAILALIPKMKPADLDRVKERFTHWLGAAGETLDAGGAALRRAALLALGAAAPVVAEPVVAAPAPVVVAPVAAKAGKGKAAKPAAAPVAPAKPISLVAPPALPNKAIVPIVRGLLADIRWPEAASVLARQLGPKAAPMLAAALAKGIDKEVRLSRKGGYSKRDSELVGSQRRGIVTALKEIKDTSVVPTLVRLLALESIRAGKVERRTETSLLGVTINALQTITGYKFGAEPQRWQEVATGKLPLVAEPPKKAAVPAPAKKATVTALPTKKGAAAAKKPATKAAKAKKPAKAVAKAKGKKPVKKAAKVAKAKKPAKAAKPKAKKAAKVAKAKKPARKSGGLKSLVVRAVRFARSGSKKVSQPRRMAAKSARRR